MGCHCILRSKGVCFLFRSHSIERTAYVCEKAGGCMDEDCDETQPAEEIQVRSDL